MFIYLIYLYIYVNKYKQATVLHHFNWFIANLYLCIYEMNVKKVFKHPTAALLIVLAYNRRQRLYTIYVCNISVYHVS